MISYSKRHYGEDRKDKQMDNLQDEGQRSTAVLIERVKAEIQRKPTPQLIVLLRALEKTL